MGLPSAAPLDPANVNSPHGKDLPSDADSSLATEDIGKMPTEITNATINATVPNGTSADVTVAAVQVQAQLNGVNSVIKKHMSGNNMPAASDAAKETAEVSKPAANVEAAKPAAQKGAAAAKPEANAA